MNAEQVHVTSMRERGEEQFDPIEKWRPWSKAFELFVIYELGFGGRILSIEPDRVVTTTQVLGCTDTTHFSGSANNLDLFCKVGGIHQYLANHDLDSFSEATFNQMQKGSMPMTAFNLTHIGPLLIGEKLAKVALLLALELLDYAHASLEDLCAVADLLQQGGRRDQVLSLLTKQEVIHGS